MSISNNPKVVAIIPARGGSKRIPRKNIKPFHGVPLIQRTISVLFEAQIFDDIIVSTDDDEIAELARTAGASVPFKRSDILSTDITPTAPVIMDVVDFLTAQNGAPPEIICTIYPAAVLINAEILRDSFVQFRTSNHDAIHSALNFPSPIYRALTLDETGAAHMVWPENRLVRSQELGEHFYDAGQFYWSKSDYWKKQLSESDAQACSIGLYLLKYWQAVDIDTSDDWEFAEKLFLLGQGPN